MATASATLDSFDQRLVLEPDATFGLLDRSLRGLGWRPQDCPGSGPSLVPGEPELAGWTQEFAAGPLIYTFNPVVHLRVLDVESLSPIQRHKVAVALPLVRRSHVVNWLKAPDPRSRLRAVFALRELNAVDELDELRVLGQDHEAFVAEAAVNAVSALQATKQQQEQWQLALRLLEREATSLAHRIAWDSGRAGKLRPRAEDCVHLFHPAIVRDIAAHYADCWKPPLLTGFASQSPQALAGFSVSALRGGAPSRFSPPATYAAVAGWLRPGCVWFYHPGSASEADEPRLDGLVSVNDKWLWCPQPYRVIQGILGSRVMSC